MYWTIFAAILISSVTGNLIVVEEYHPRPVIDILPKSPYTKEDLHELGDDLGLNIFHGQEASPENAKSGFLPLGLAPRKPTTYNRNVPKCKTWHIDEITKVPTCLELVEVRPRPTIKRKEPYTQEDLNELGEELAINIFYGEEASPENKNSGFLPLGIGPRRPLSSTPRRPGRKVCEEWVINEITKVPKCVKLRRFRRRKNNPTPKK